MGRRLAVLFTLTLLAAALAVPDGTRYGDGNKDGTHGVGSGDHTHGGLYEKSGAVGGAAGGYGHGADGKANSYGG
ncbi:uncharacterized protein LOC132903300 [Amyelois transitella]|uniref:uncharacterized protein LOC132903300 n=1 Tax=Amyelois transitella TaxID=680683 RepID=UPI0029904574|nr:uncharacterized protein LOC132903300 [Amyelois transitella]